MSPSSTHVLRSLACLPLAATAVAGAATPAADLRATAWSFHHENILGTSMQLTLSGTANLAAAAHAESAALASIDRDNLILSAWRNDSQLTQWLSTRNTPQPVSPELLEVLALFDHWRDRTHGALNPAAEAAARFWLAAAAEHRQPTPDELARTIAAINHPHWSLDPANRTATHLSATPLVLASFTKSYIADRAASAALAAGASGVMLNIGGDIVVCGDLTQPIAIANSLAHAENDAPVDILLLRDRAIATSGSYRRTIAHTAASHIIDPRAAQPTAHILSSTVIARDATTAGALATAFSVLTPVESHAIAQSTAGVDYLLYTRDGQRIASDGWQTYQAPTLQRASFAPARKPAVAQNFILNINLEIAGATDYRYRRPYVAVWVEDENHFPVRTIALWYQRERWLSELRSWYRDDQLRYRTENAALPQTISSATRAPGKYTLKWDGTDNQGKPVKPGKYTVFIEAAREHGGYDLLHQEIDLNGQPQEHSFAPGNELGAVTLDYRQQ